MTIFLLFVASRHLGKVSFKMRYDKYIVILQHVSTCCLMLENYQVLEKKEDVTVVLS